MGETRYNADIKTRLQNSVAKDALEMDPFDALGRIPTAVVYVSALCCSAWCNSEAIHFGGGNTRFSSNRLLYKTRNHYLFAVCYSTCTLLFWKEFLGIGKCLLTEQSKSYLHELCLYLKAIFKYKCLIYGLYQSTYFYIKSSVKIV